MAMGPQQTEAEIACRLAATLLPGSRNEITATQLRTWAIEYLTEYDAELRRFPELVGKSHWNLWMMDARSEDALLAVMIFRPDSLEFLCGTGDAFMIKRFAESDFRNDVEQLPARIVGGFAVPQGRLKLDRETAEIWLPRGW
jgi:hypothetical protein